MFWKTWCRVGRCDPFHPLNSQHFVWCDVSKKCCKLNHFIVHWFRVAFFCKPIMCHVCECMCVVETYTSLINRCNNARVDFHLSVNSFLSAHSTRIKGTSSQYSHARLTFVWDASKRNGKLGIDFPSLKLDLHFIRQTPLFPGTLPCCTTIYWRNSPCVRIVASSHL